MSTPTRPCSNPWLFTTIVLGGFACCPPVLGNIFDPDATPVSIMVERHTLFRTLIFPFMLTLFAELPVVMFVLRKNIPIAASALVAFVAGILSYSLAFYLVFYRGMHLYPAEGVVTGVEFLLFFVATWILDRLDVVLDPPTVGRLFAASLAANLWSFAICIAFYI